MLITEVKKKKKKTCFQKTKFKLSNKFSYISVE